MRDQNTHLSDERLLLFADGEIRGREKSAIQDHLTACWSCRLRLREFDEAVRNAAKLHQQDADRPLPAPEGPRALLRARLRELATASPSSGAMSSGNRLLRGVAVLAGIAALAVLVWPGRNSGDGLAIPRSDLTPGAVRAVAATDVCMNNLGGNAEVVPAIQRQVFAEYGMPNAASRAYEVDYLITPALGGSDDIRNLWPQPYHGSPWNAHVKDALEDRLREMVCSGQLDLATAQREIALNWIAAYQKYFHTRRPLPQHLRRAEESE
jgi:hypothetical protein